MKRREGISAMNNPRRMLLFLILASVLMFALGVFVGNRYTVSLAEAFDGGGGISFTAGNFRDKTN